MRAAGPAAAGDVPGAGGDGHRAWRGEGGPQAHVDGGRGRAVEARQHPDGARHLQKGVRRVPGQKVCLEVRLTLPSYPARARLTVGARAGSTFRSSLPRGVLLMLIQLVLAPPCCPPTRVSAARSLTATAVPLSLRMMPLAAPASRLHVHWSCAHSVAGGRRSARRRTGRPRASTRCWRGPSNSVRTPRSCGSCGPRSAGSPATCRARGRSWARCGSPDPLNRPSHSGLQHEP